MQLFWLLFFTNKLSFFDFLKRSGFHIWCQLLSMQNICTKMKTLTDGLQNMMYDVDLKYIYSSCNEIDYFEIGVTSVNSFEDYHICHLDELHPLTFEAGGTLLSLNVL